jgi:serine/threonine protein kinase
VTATDGERASRRSQTGTPAFYSTEMCVLPPKPFHGRPADVWAAGCTLCMLVSGHLPFEADNMPEVWRRVKEEPPELPANISDSLRELLLSMLQKNPANRPTIKALRTHAWVTRDGATPMEEQAFLPLEITDDDIRNAVKNMNNIFVILKLAKKWKAFAAQKAAERRAANPPAAAPVAPSPSKATKKKGFFRSSGHSPHEGAHDDKTPKPKGHGFFHKPERASDKSQASDKSLTSPGSTKSVLSPTNAGQ